MRLLLLVFTLFPLSHSHALETVHYTHLLANTDALNEYFLGQLELALQKSESTFGPYQLAQVQPSMYQSSALSALKKRNKVNVVWTTFSEERGAHAKAIRFDLLRGLNNFKLIVHSERSKRVFNAVEKVEDLIPMTGLQGHDWPDTYSLRQNGLRIKNDFLFQDIVSKVALSENFYYLSNVLSYKEPLGAHSNLLHANTGVLIYFESPINFFVNKSSSTLALRIEQGLETAFEDGSFERLLHSFLADNRSFKSLSLDTRKVIQLARFPRKNEKVLDRQGSIDSLSELIELKKTITQHVVE